jgi:hypothetical protein
MLIRLRRTALSKTPHALADGLMLVFKHPVKDQIWWRFAPRRHNDLSLTRCLPRCQGHIVRFPFDAVHVDFMLKAA